MSLSLATFILIVIWVGSEIALGFAKRSRAPGSDSLDRSSLRLLWIVITISVTAAMMVSGRGWGVFVPGPWEAIGVVLILAGLAIRWWAIRSLGRAFTVDVAIAKDQKLMDQGLYAWIRHPSYAGSLLSFVGMGIALRNWASLLALMIPISSVFLYRIAVEERALRTAFGEDYDRYARRTRRLVPFLY